MSKQMDLEGTITDIDVMHHGRPIFRKHVSDTWGFNELLIAKKLYEHTLPHNVRIYHVYDSPCLKYIDMEFLGFDKNTYKKDIFYDDIGKAILELHEQRIIYIDLKSDNVGYSDIDKCWKLFDYDCSGICNELFNEWIIKPPFYYNYKEAIKLVYKLDVNIMEIVPEMYTFPDFREIDRVLYEHYKEQRSVKNKNKSSTSSSV